MLAYYVDAVRRAAEEKARLEGLVEAEARKPRWRRRVDSLRCLKGVDGFRVLPPREQREDLHVENIDRAYKGLPPIQPKKSIIVEFLKARKAKVCPVIEYKAE